MSDGYQGFKANSDLHGVLARLYASEINASIATDWDGGWDVKLGDPLNGFKAETTIETMRDSFGVAACQDALERVAEWLDEQARVHFPESVYAKTAWCCYVGCTEVAAVELVALRHTGGDEVDGRVLTPTGNAGPDPYSDFTHACWAHVGELLGFQPEAIERSNIYWQVRTLAPAMLAR